MPATNTDWVNLLNSMKTNWAKELFSGTFPTFDTIYTEELPTNGHYRMIVCHSDNAWVPSIPLLDFQWVNANNRFEHWELGQSATSLKKFSTGQIAKRIYGALGAYAGSRYSILNRQPALTQFILTEISDGYSNFDETKKAEYDAIEAAKLVSGTHYTTVGISKMYNQLGRSLADKLYLADRYN